MLRWLVAVTMVCGVWVMLCALFFWQDYFPDDDHRELGFFIGLGMALIGGALLDSLGDE